MDGTSGVQAKWMASHLQGTPPGTPKRIKSGAREVCAAAQKVIKLEMKSARYSKEIFKLKKASKTRDLIEICERLHKEHESAFIEFDEEVRSNLPNYAKELFAAYFRLFLCKRYLVSNMKRRVDVCRQLRSEVETQSDRVGCLIAEGQQACEARSWYKLFVMEANGRRALIQYTMDCLKLSQCVSTQQFAPASSTTSRSSSDTTFHSPILDDDSRLPRLQQLLVFVFRSLHMVHCCPTPSQQAFAAVQIGREPKQLSTAHLITASAAYAWAIFVNAYCASLTECQCTATCSVDPNFLNNLEPTFDCAPLCDRDHVVCQVHPDCGERDYLWYVFRLAGLVILANPFVLASLQKTKNIDRTDQDIAYATYGGTSWLTNRLHKFWERQVDWGFNWVETLMHSHRDSFWEGVRQGLLIKKI